MQMPKKGQLPPDIDMCVSKEDADSVVDINSDEESLASFVAADNSFTSHRAYITPVIAASPKVYQRRETNQTDIHTIG